MTEESLREICRKRGASILSCRPEWRHLLLLQKFMIPGAITSFAKSGTEISPLRFTWVEMTKRSTGNNENPSCELAQLFDTRAAATIRCGSLLDP